jgi:DNA-binding transcriptional LysR family regulator
MNFKALRAFTLVMELGSITAAADKLNLSTPAVSRLIAQLQAETKLKLFNRGHRGVSPTEAGQLFMKEAQRILTDLEELPDVIRKIKRRTFQRLSILTTPRLVPALMVPAIARLSALHAEVRCSLDVQPKWELERSLTRNRYDICAAIMPVPNNTLAVRPLYRVVSEVVLPKTHPLASHDHVTAHDLQHERLIGFLPGQLLRRQVSDLFRNAGIEMEYCMEISSSSIAADLTRMNCGLSIADRLLCTGMNMDGLTSVPFHPRIWTTVVALYSKDEALSEPAALFLECMLEVLNGFARQPANADIIDVFSGDPAVATFPPAAIRSRPPRRGRERVARRLP